MARLVESPARAVRDGGRGHGRAAHAVEHPGGREQDLAGRATSAEALEERIVERVAGVRKRLRREERGDPGRDERAGLVGREAGQRDREIGLDIGPRGAKDLPEARHDDDEVTGSPADRPRGPQQRAEIGPVRSRGEREALGLVEADDERARAADHRGEGGDQVAGALFGRETIGGRQSDRGEVLRVEVLAAEPVERDPRVLSPPDGDERGDGVRSREVGRFPEGEPDEPGGELRPLRVPVEATSADVLDEPAPRGLERSEVAAVAAVVAVPALDVGEEREREELVDEPFERPLVGARDRAAVAACIPEAVDEPVAEVTVDAPAVHVRVDEDEERVAREAALDPREQVRLARAALADEDAEAGPTFEGRVAGGELQPAPGFRVHVRRVLGGRPRIADDPLAERVLAA